MRYEQLLFYSIPIFFSISGKPTSEVVERFLGGLLNKLTKPDGECVYHISIEVSKEANCCGTFLQLPWNSAVLCSLWQILIT